MQRTPRERRGWQSVVTGAGSLILFVRQMTFQHILDALTVSPAKVAFQYSMRFFYGEAVTHFR